MPKQVTPELSIMQHLLHKILICWLDIRFKLITPHGAIINESSHELLNADLFVVTLEYATKIFLLEAMKESRAYRIPDHWGIVRSLASSVDWVAFCVWVSFGWNVEAGFDPVLYVMKGILEQTLNQQLVWGLQLSLIPVLWLWSLPSLLSMILSTMRWLETILLEFFASDMEMIKDIDSVWITSIHNYCGCSWYGSSNCCHAYHVLRWESPSSISALATDPCSIHSDLTIVVGICIVWTYRW